MSCEKPGAMITPLRDARECETLGCGKDELLARVEPDLVDEHRVLCPIHQALWLREVANR